MLRGIEGILTGRSSMQVEGLQQIQVDRMIKLAKLPAFKNLPQKVQANVVSTTVCVCMCACASEHTCLCVCIV